jgi:hypothetical protein
METDPAQRAVTGAPVPGESTRIQLARIAAAAAGNLDDVHALDPGEDHRYCTWAGSEPIAGVVVVAEGDPGSYGMTLYIQARLVDLHGLAEDLRHVVGRAVDDRGLSAHLDAIGVQITDVVSDRNRA